MNTTFVPSTTEQGEAIINAMFGWSAEKEAPPSDQLGGLSKGANSENLYCEDSTIV